QNVEEGRCGECRGTRRKGNRSGQQAETFFHAHEMLRFIVMAMVEATAQLIHRHKRRTRHRQAANVWGGYRPDDRHGPPLVLIWVARRLKASNSRSHATLSPAGQGFT